MKQVIMTWDEYEELEKKSAQLLNLTSYIYENDQYKELDEKIKAGEFDNTTNITISVIE